MMCFATIFLLESLNQFNNPNGVSIFGTGWAVNCATLMWIDAIDP
jgi:hypothetical protein